MIRITLSNDNLGKLTIKDAIGINDLKLTAKRSEQGDGVLFVVVLGVKLIKRGRRFLMQAFEFEGGIDANVGFLVEQYDPNTFEWLLYYNGKVDFNINDLGEVDIEVAVTQVGPQVDLTNAFERDMQLASTLTPNGTSLPALSTINALPMHSKTIQRISKSSLSESQVDPLYTSSGFGAISPNSFRLYITMDTPNIELDEIKESTPTPTQLVNNDYLGSTPDINETPESKFLYRYKLSEGGHHKLTIDGSQKLYGTAATGWDLFWNVHIVYPEGGVSHTFGADSASGDTIETTFNDVFEFDAVPGTIVYVYQVVDIDISLNTTLQIFAGPTPFSITLEGATTVAESTTYAVMIYEAVERIVKYHSNNQLAFQSMLLGRTDIGYAVDGSASLIAITNGRALRKSPNFTLFARAIDLTWNLKDALEFLSLRCIGWGFEYIAGVLTFVVEQKAYFFKPIVAVDLGKCFKPRRRLLSDKFYATVSVEYSAKIEKTEINSIDEFNTSHTFAFPNKNTKNELKLSTNVVVGGYLIETQRRLIGSSEEGKFDSAIFAIDCVRDGGGFKPRKTEGFSSITNIIDPDSGYNYNFAPSRLLNEYWKDTLATNTIRSLSKIMKFSSGTGNYTMVAKKTTEPVAIDERGSIDLTNAKPLWDNFEYLFEKEVKLDRNQILVAIANPDKQWKFTDRKGISYVGWLTINPVEHDTNHNKATVKLLKGFIIDNTPSEDPTPIVDIAFSSTLVANTDGYTYRTQFTTSPVIVFNLDSPIDSEETFQLAENVVPTNVLKTSNGGIAESGVAIEWYKLIEGVLTLVHSVNFITGNLVNADYAYTDCVVGDTLNILIYEQ